ncbi:MAG: GIY-YIG nuclease family protein, partial [Candidatus Actinomarina sp.]|nr:GIY-YIG nuclease family protein [Candidatus Actinomarina sp.]
MSQIVYILTNEAMPDMVKIGLTSTTVEDRMKTLQSTGVPLPFTCYYAAEVEDASKIEKALHAGYADSRVNPNREFFNISPEAARAILKEFEITDQTVGEQFENEDEKIAFEKASKVKSFFNFDEVGIKPGEKLVFIRDESITCVVHDSSTIKFKDEVTNLTASVKSILDPDKTGKTYNGVVCF